MTEAEFVGIDLPAAPAALPILEAAVEGLLQRVGYLEEPVARAAVARVLSAAGEAVAAEPTRTPPGRRLSARALVGGSPNRLRLELDGSPVYEAQLPAHPTDRRDPDGTASLGLGLYLTRQVMDRVEYHPQAGGNCWHLVKTLPLTNDQGDVNQSQLVRLSLPAGYRYLNMVGTCIEAMLAPLASASQELIHDVQLAAQETCTNIVDHAYAHRPGTIEVNLNLDVERGLFTVDTRDEGPFTFDLAAVPDPFELSPSPRGRLLSASALLFASTTLVNGGNYLFNLILGRWLGPGAFADLSLIVTLLLMIGFVAVGFQQTAARFSALLVAAADSATLSGLRHWLRRWAFVAGLGLLVLLVGGAAWWQRFFHTASAWPFVILGLGLPFYLAQSVDRGVLQGQTRFGLLSASYQAEMWVRLLAGVGLVALGWGVAGAVGALSLSLVATWVVASRAGQELVAPGPLPVSQRQAVTRFAGPVIMAELSQILINNSDILIVKHFFEQTAAGHYAGLALIGRMVFFATWSVVIVMFPLVAQKQQRGEPHRYLLGVALGLVSVVSAGIIAAAALVPELIVGLLFGQAYLAVAPLLWLYALATALYALSNVVVNYRLSLGNGSGTVLAVLAGMAQVAGLWLFHDSLQQVVLVQVAIMAVLLVGLVVGELRAAGRPADQRIGGSADQRIGG